MNIRTFGIRLLCASMLLVFFANCSSSGTDRDNRLIGKWVVDRILGDTDPDEDIATLFYEADGTGRVLEDELMIDILWETMGNSIITTIPDFDLTVESQYSLSPSRNVLSTTSDLGDGVVITEVYYRFLENHPEELLGTWTPISKALNGEVIENDEEVLVLEDDGVGSVRWGVTEDRILLLDIDTLRGLAWEFEIVEGEGETFLVIVENNDSGEIIVTYTKS